MSEAVKAGTKLFVGHNSDNSTDGRKDVGEVVGSFSRMVSGKLQALVVTILGPDTDKLDICSIEADAEFDNSGNVGDIGDITGIALGSSLRDSPAFHGAQRVASLQCFAEEIKTDPKPLEKGENKIMTFSEIKQGIKDLNIFPHQIFTEDEMKSDNTYGKLFQEIELLTKDKEDLNNKVLDFEKSTKDAARSNDIATAKSRLEKLIPEGTTEKSKAYILKEFNPEIIADLSDASLKSTVDALQVKYSEDIKFFGIEPTDGPSGSSDDGESKTGDTDPIEAAVAATMED